MKKVICFIGLLLFMVILAGCKNFSTDDIMEAHLEKGPSIEVDPQSYIFVRTVDASFGARETKAEANIISVYLYEYHADDPQGDKPSRHTYAYLVVEDKYALKNGASLAVDLSKYIIIYSDKASANAANEEVLLKNAEDILNDHRTLLEFGQIPTFDLLEILQEIN